jgi:hypothetical protein
MTGRETGCRCRRRPRQALLPPFRRTARLERGLRRAIVGLTALSALGLLAGTPLGRFAVVSLAVRGHALLLRPVRRTPSRHELDLLWTLRRQRGLADTAAQFRKVASGVSPQMQALLRVAGMGPGNGLLRWANYDRTLLFSSRVFDPDDSGRAYRLRPRTRSVWLRDRTLVGSPFGMLLAPDTPAVRAAAEAAGVLVVDGSEQITNAWGLRGPEPRLDAPVRGIVLGDSFMQGLFIGDDETPPAALERFLRHALGTPVCVLNTGHYGYSPEQYYHTLVEYAGRFRPQFVVVSVSPNDFGDGVAVLHGHGDWPEAVYWMGRIMGYCRERGMLCVVAAVPVDARLEGQRMDGFFPGQLANACRLDSRTYCYPFDDFVDAHLRLAAAARRRGEAVTRSPLYNRQLNDGHFSAAGASVWGGAVGRRVAALLQSDPPAPLTHQEPAGIARR